MKSLILASILFLSGCSALQVPHWDAREYNELVTIAAESQYGVCAQDQVERLTALSRHLLIYSAFLPYNERIASGVDILNETIKDLTPSGRVGSTFCMLKLKVIHTMALELTQAAGGKPK